MAIVNSSNPHRVGFHGEPTATLEWCEVRSPFFTVFPSGSSKRLEMANTLSNIVTIGFALYGAYLSTSQYRSGWFHATLQFQAQLADELPMIYVTSTALWLLFDQDSGFDFNRRNIERLIHVELVRLSLAPFRQKLKGFDSYVNRNPVYHQVVFAGLLFTIAFRIYYLLTRSRLGTSIPANKRREIGTLFAFGAAQFLFAFLLWNIDNIFCKPLTRWKAALGNPHFVLLELHAWWHIICELSSQQYSGLH
ncbi:ceramidase-domain-containing protein [Favolaschia claudopus]|uniref:Ceramidase-domain-containing protein n=1 Tax=Favolaschia claudopus TaxID=2862362 RepID=A0AAW0EGP9_9AGAR